MSCMVSAYMYTDKLKKFITQIKKICDFIQEEGAGYGIDVYDVRLMVQQEDFGADEVRGLSSRIFYNSESRNFDLIVLSGERNFDSTNSTHIYDADRNEKYLLGDDDF